MVVLYAARHRMAVPCLARWLLALGIAATLTANMAQGWSHGLVGAVVRPGLWSVSSARTSSWPGSSARPGRPTAGRQQGISARARPAVMRCLLSRPQPLTASAPRGVGPARQTRPDVPRVRPPGSRPSRPAGSVTGRRPGPARALTRRWPRTGSACRPATRCRNAGSRRCSGAPPAAGRAPGSPRPGRHCRCQTPPGTPVTAYP
jgi:hypothetical protein